MEKESIYQMKLGKIYPLLVQKAVRKGRTQAEVDTVICWLTGYSREELCALAQGAISYGDFFRQAPHLNERREEIRGGVCGVRVEEIQEPLLQEIRRLDKLIDELAKGKPLAKSLRGGVCRPRPWRAKPQQIARPRLISGARFWFSGPSVPM